MSLPRFLAGPRRVGDTSTPARVFDHVAPSPVTPVPRWWNHPVTVMVAAVLGAAPLLSIPYLSPLTGVLLLLTGCVLMWFAETSRQWWADSYTRAVKEARWVATQAGYRLEGRGARLSWAQGERGCHDPMLATVDHHDGGWHLTLHSAPLARVPDHP